MSQFCFKKTLLVPFIPFKLTILVSKKATILGWKTHETALCDCNPEVKAPKTSNEVAWSLELWVQPGPPLHRWDQQTWFIMHHWDFGPVHPKGFSAKCHQPGTKLSLILRLVCIEAFDKCDETGTGRPRHWFVVVPWLQPSLSVCVCVLLSSFCLVSLDCVLQGRQYSERGKEQICSDLAPPSMPAWQIQNGDPGHAKEITQSWPYRLENGGKNDLQICSVQSFLTSAAHILHIHSCLFCADQLWGVLSRRLANCDAMLTDEAGTGHSQSCCHPTVYFALIPKLVGNLYFSHGKPGYEKKIGGWMQKAWPEELGWYQHWHPDPEAQRYLAKYI